MCTCFLHWGVNPLALRTWISEAAFWTVTKCDSHKLRQFRNPCRRILGFVAFVIMAVTAQTESNNTENVFWVLGRVNMFTFNINMKSFIFAHFGVISLLYLFVCMYISYKAHNRFTKETFLIVSHVDVNMFLHSGVYPLELQTWIWEVVFWTVTKCDSHKMRQFRNPCRRILWFVAFCDHGRDGTNWVQSHWKRVLGTWERTHVHFWYEYERLSFDPFSYYLPYVLYIIHQTWGARMNLGYVSNYIEKVL